MVCVLPTVSTSAPRQTMLWRTLKTPASRNMSGGGPAYELPMSSRLPADNSKSTLRGAASYTLARLWASSQLADTTNNLSTQQQEPPLCQQLCAPWQAWPQPAFQLRPGPLCDRDIPGVGALRPALPDALIRRHSRPDCPALHECAHRLSEHRGDLRHHGAMISEARGDMARLQIVEGGVDVHRQHSDWIHTMALAMHP